MKTLTSLCILLALAACGGSPSDQQTTPQPDNRTISGSAIKGPLQGATLRIYNFDPTTPNLISGAPIVEGNTNLLTAFENLTVPSDSTLPLIINVDGTTATDINTSTTPIITSMRTIITESMLAAGKPIYATPLTTMILEVTRQNADASTGEFSGDGDTQITAAEFETALPIASKLVIESLGFGMDSNANPFTTPPLVTNNTTDTTTLAAAARYRLAIEAIGTLVMELQTDIASTTPAPTTNELLMALANDLADGEIDGNNFGSSVNELSEVNDLTGILSTDISTKQIPNTTPITMVGDIETLMIMEVETTNINISEAMLDPLRENGLANITPEPIKLIPDSDGDGINNQEDSDSNNACIPNAFVSACTQDTDGDGINDFNEGEFIDTDSDGLFDYEESLLTDTDLDNTNNQADPANSDACIPNIFVAACTQDTDSDGTTDFNEGELTDTDGDGLFDYQESSLIDTDSDGTNDQTDSANNNTCIPNVFISVCMQDTDGDGTTDFNEGELIDTDGDGSFDYQESVLTDSDLDGTNDQIDIANDNACIPNAFVSVCAQDTDGDGTTDFNEGEMADTDSDGLLDYQESSLDDTDADGTNDQTDPANNDPCIPNMNTTACTSNGIATRPSNTSCIAPEVPIASSGTIGLQRRFPNVSFSSPVKALQAPNDTSHWYILEQAGSIKRILNDDNTSTSETYLDIAVTYIQGKEMGLLGMAFSPNWPATKAFYVYYTNNKTGGGLQSVVSRYVISNDDPLPATFAEEIIMTVDQTNDNHNGGNMEFGNDGYLYIGLGDGGGPNDPLDRAQDTRNMLGSMLRIDVEGVDSATKYTIPSDNPFAKDENGDDNPKCSPWGNPNNCPEIYAWGLRNPWRWSIDLPTNTIWTGDVGQDLREEISQITLGGNFGWPCKEGSVDNTTRQVPCTANNPINPAFEYAHVDENTSYSVTGGFVYRGSQIPSLTGRYLFADIYSGQIWALDGNTTMGYTAEEMINWPDPIAISSFAKDHAGEHYVLDIISGGMYQIVSDGEVIDDSAIPMNLADIGCVSAADPSLPSSGLIPYEPNARFWSDGADKSRWIAIPDNETITVPDTINMAASDHSPWVYPTGTVTMKNFVVENKLIETRFYMHHPDGRWAGYTYEWNEDETTATRVVGGKTRDLTHTQQPQQWIYPSEGECKQCHTAAAGHVLGMSTAQLNHALTYPDSGINDNQLETLNHIGYFTQNVPEPVTILQTITDPTDVSNTLLDRAKAYLHTNCASCHQPGTGVNVSMDLRFETPLNDMNIIDADLQRSDLGISNAKRIASGKPENSIILERMKRTDGERMPPIGSNIVDDAGVMLIKEWICSLSTSPSSSCM